jgi:hypothetical protein
MTWDTIAPFLRHALQFGAGLLVAKGLLDTANAEILVGGFVSIASVAWWLFSRAKTV